jgi:hypothetical protein
MRGTVAAERRDLPCRRSDLPDWNIPALLSLVVSTLCGALLLSGALGATSQSVAALIAGAIQIVLAFAVAQGSRSQAAGRVSI